MNITVTRAARDGADRQIVRNLFVQFYSTLSEYDPNLVMNANGLPTWEPEGVANSETDEGWWRINWAFREEFDPYIIRVDGVPAGYALVATEGGMLPENVDFDLFDFFIAPKYRRMGVGRIAAPRIFDLYIGIWTLFYLDKNQHARRFWHQVVGDYTNGNYETLDNDTQLRFRNDSAGKRVESGE